MPRRSSAPDGTTNVKNPTVAGRSASDRWLLDNPRERQPWGTSLGRATSRLCSLWRSTSEDGIS